MNAMVLEKSLVPKVMLTQFLECNNYSVTSLNGDYSSLNTEIKENLKADTAMLFLDYNVEGDIWKAIHDLQELKNKISFKIIVSCSEQDKVEVLPDFVGQYDIFCTKPFTVEKLRKTLGDINEKNN